MPDLVSLCLSGVGKTMLARAIAKECNATFLSISSSTVMDKFIGETEKLVDAVFSVVGPAPCTLMHIRGAFRLMLSQPHAQGHLSVASCQRERTLWRPVVLSDHVWQ